MYVVAVTFVTTEAGQAEFLERVTENARLSLDQEPGCHRFDVCVDPNTPTEIFLYELYTDRAAFEVHLKSVHFAEFDAAVAELVADKTVKTYTLA